MRALKDADVQRSLGAAYAKAFAKYVKQSSAVHELSIANNLVQLALDYVENSGVMRVQKVNVRIGALSCVHRDALLFCFDLATEDTALAGASLHITELPIVIYCPQCQLLQELPGVQAFQCPLCQTPSSDIRQGRELDIESIEVVDMGSP
jgi:hydrogenase nickel incorporation protein HypA/HybF